MSDPELAARVRVEKPRRPTLADHAQLAGYLRSEALIRAMHAREYRHQSESEERPAEARALRKFAVLDAAKAAWFEMWANWIGRDV